MGHINLSSPPKQRNNPLPRKWQLLDFISIIFFSIVILFFLLIFTPLGDSLAASGTQALIRSNSADPKQRHALIESGKHPEIQPCGNDSVDYMPCEDPNRNSQLSREMNFYRERHCPKPEDSPLCLVPPPQGYHVPIQWPESLHKHVDAWIRRSQVLHNKAIERENMLFPKYTVMPTFFNNDFLENNWERIVKTVTGSLKIFPAWWNVDIVLIPIKCPNEHWFLLQIKIFILELTIFYRELEQVSDALQSRIMSGYEENLLRFLEEINYTSS